MKVQAKAPTKEERVFGLLKKWIDEDSRSMRSVQIKMKREPRIGEEPPHKAMIDVWIYSHELNHGTCLTVDQIIEEVPDGDFTAYLLRHETQRCKERLQMDAKQLREVGIDPMDVLRCKGDRNDR
jgi:hypothetical protein